MLARIACFTIGILLLQQLPQLPSGWWLLLLPVLFFLTMYWQAVRWLLWGSLGMAWCGLFAWWILQQGIDAEHEGQDLLVSGEIVSIPEPRQYGTRFLFIPDLHPELDQPLGLVQLNWYGRVPSLQQGQRWQLKIRLKQPNGFINPSGFDYEGWLFQQRVRAVGYVRNTKADAELNQLLRSAEGHWIDRQRQWLSQRFQVILSDSPYLGMIEALAIGQRLRISESQWQVLTATGTNHLMAISGLHVGLVAGMVMWLAGWLWRRSATLCLMFPARKAGAVAGVLAALYYAALAGFAIPTQRALIMLMVVMVAILMQRQLVAAPILAIAWFIILLLDPFATLSMGLWLSFAAVAIILYAMSARSHTRSLTWRWGRVHWVIMIGLTPVLLVSFQQAPLYSFIANFIAVPVVGILVVPLVLLASALMVVAAPVATWLLQFVDLLFHGLWPLMMTIADWPLAQWKQHQPVWWTVPCAVVGILWLLAPKGWPARWLGLLWIAPMLWIAPSPPKHGELWLTILDVGQGLSVVARTANHTLLYDAGPALGSLDSGKAVILPYLHSVGIHRLSHLILSHDDRDHTGGAESLLRGIAVEQLTSPAISRFSHHPGGDCQAGDRWQWDGVEFEILHPQQWSKWPRDNNRSCVLRIEAPGGSVLLPGDIEQKVEMHLSEVLGEQLRSDILLAGHHGSNSSSTSEFLQAVAADYVIHATGYRNRYHFPHQDVVSRIEQSGALQLNSAESGAILFKILPQQGILPPQEFRISNTRIWHRD